MIYGSVCSGIEAATVAWEGLGWKPSFFSEIEPFPRSVLQHHYPNVPLHGDFTTIGANNYEAIDLLVGGTPCQSFSVAGLRKGLSDDRGNLALEFIKLAQRLRPRWIVWENVPGVLSSNGGRDFACFVRGLAECGYHCAYRVLDAQYFGLAQRRKRVFLVGYFGDWRPPVQVLFEPKSVSGYSKPSREKRKKTSRGTGASFTDSSFGGYREGVGTLRANWGDLGGGGETLVCHGTQDPCVKTNCSFSLGRNNGGENIVFQMQRSDQYKKEDLASTISARDYKSATDLVAQCVEPSRYDAMRYHGETAPTLQAFMGTGGGNIPCWFDTWSVRKLTPIECERLQGFPDNHTRIPWRNKAEEDCPDGPRYKAAGNSMPTTVMKWLGQRIQIVHNKNKG